MNTSDHHPPPYLGDSPRKRAVNLTLSEGLIAEARHYTSNLSATVEELLATYVVERHHAEAGRRQEADACAAEWNDVNAKIGSFADEHSTL